MLVRIRVEANDLGEMRSLWGWLREDRDIPIAGALTAIQDPSDDTLGGLEIAGLVIGSALSAGQLVTGIMQWRGSRPKPPIIIIVREDGRVVRIAESGDAARQKAIEQLEDE